MQKLHNILQQDAAKIETILLQDIDALASDNEPLLIEVLRYGLLGAGKRIRPFLVLTAAALCGNTTVECYPLATAFEYLHAATLFHDDIIDNSLLRRGKPSVPAQFGTTTAILAGDFLLAHAMEIVALKTGAAGLKIFNQATRGMVNGELCQLHNANTFSISIDEYKKAVMRKTGVLIASSCEIGGLFAGAKEKECTALRCYGENLGYAFQIIDDILDYQGNTQKTGKKVGNDLAEGKMTLPLIYAITHSDKKDRSRLLEILKNSDLRKTKESFSEVSTLIENNQGFMDAQTEARKAIRKGVTALNIFAGKDAKEYKSRLLLLAEFILQRNK